jgi:DNA-binding CsgD family transcriptional regulator/PAS domain-containing protein
VEALTESLASAVGRLNGRKSRPVRIILDADVLPGWLKDDHEMTKLHVSLKNIASSLPVILLQSYPVNILPTSFAVSLFSPYVLIFLSETVRRKVFRSLDTVADESLVLDLAIEQIVLKGQRNLWTLFRSPANEQLHSFSPRFFGHYADALLMLDISLSVVYASPRMGDLVGVPISSLNGRRLEEFLPADTVRVFRTRVSLLVMQSIEPNLSGNQSMIQEVRFEIPWEVSPAAHGRKTIPSVRQCTVSALAGNGAIYGYLCTISESRSVSIPITIGDPTRGVPASSGASDDESRPSSGLTRREYEIIGLIVAGMPNKVIADRLDLAEITVKKHLTNIYRKLNVKNRFDLLRMARWS